MRGFARLIGGDRLSSAGVAGSLFLALVVALGGASADGIVANATVQIAAILLAAWLLAKRPAEAVTSGAGRALVALFGLAILLCILQLVPLPPAIWSALPGRGFVVEGYRLLGIELPWRPLALSPGGPQRAAISLIAPLAMVLLALASGRSGVRLMLVTLLGLAIVVLLVGLGQVSGGPQSQFYFYDVATRDAAIGTFRNANHLGALMAITVPLTAGLVGRPLLQGGSRNQASLGYALLAAMTAFALLGAYLSGSFAALLLSAVGIGASAAIVFPRLDARLRGIAVFGLIVAAGAALILAVVQSDLIALADESGVGSAARHAMWQATWQLICQFWMFGSGFGSFEQLFALHQDPATVTSVFVNHAHNDWLEFLLEAGIPGIALGLAAIAWFCRRLYALWMRAGDRDPLGQGASIAAMLLLLHSIVDYPLRTAALACIFALCCAIMAQASREEKARKPARGAAPSPQARHLSAD